MAHHVTLEGSVTPTDALPRGVQRTVAVTDEIRKLVAIGGAIVVAGSLDEPDTAAYGDSDGAEAPEPVGADEPQPAEADAAPKRGRARKAAEPDEPQP